MDAVQRFSEELEQLRPSLTPSQLKKLRKKRAKLSQQQAALHQQALEHQEDGSEGAEQPSPGKKWARGMEADQQLATDGSDAPTHDQQQQSDSQPATEQFSSHGPSAAAAAAAAAAAGHEEAVSAVVPMLQQQQQEQHKRRQQQPWRERSPLQLALGLPSSSTSTGPCRSDLSGQLVMMQQELASHSNSTTSALMLPPGAAPPLPAVTSAGGTRPAATAAAAAAGGTTDGHHRHQQQQDDAAPDSSGEAAAAPSRKRSRPSCQYGNYHHYYGYRLKPAGFEDPRLKVLDRSIFAGADVLDVGCNEGLVTLALALHAGARSVTGVDIDPALVAKACTNLSRSRSALNQQMHAAIRDRDAGGGGPGARQLQLELHDGSEDNGAGSSSSSTAPLAGPLDVIAAASSGMRPPARRANAHHLSNGSSSSSSASAETGTQQQPLQQQPLQQPLQQQPLHHQQQQLLSPHARIVAAQRHIKALSRVSFRAGNWLSLPVPSNKYEAITCFSVTKWVQLNWGDDGIMQLFHKFYRCLAPGGLLVLEPQPFKSYKSAVHKPGVSGAAFHDLSRLKLRPEGYADFLTRRVGFEMVQQLHAVSAAVGADAVPLKGFDRPILLLRKPPAAAAAAAAAGGAASRRQRHSGGPAAGGGGRSVDGDEQDELQEGASALE